MGWVMMSERELNRVEVLSQVVDGRIASSEAAQVLGMSIRQVQRLLVRFRRDGARSVRHRARGRRSNNHKNDAVREYALSLIRESYADFGPTLATEKLAEDHGLTVSRETVRKWMMAEGLWLKKAAWRAFHQPRLRRERYGELIQIDGSDHRWFEDRADPCTLLVFIDDATSKLMELRFVRSESTVSYFAALERYLTTHGRPVAFYSDKHTVFRVAKKDASGGAGMTQFGRALSELNIEILCANSSQAKGRVERANRTLQDRLVKELRLAGVTGIEDGNAFLPGFIERFNAKFAKVLARPDNLHRALNTEPDRLADILCWRDTRSVGRQLTLMYERKKYMLEVNDQTRDLVGKDVETYAFADGRFQIRWKGVSLPYRVFDKNQRVTHVAVTSHKLLGDQLAMIKEMQEAMDAKGPPKKARMKTNSEKSGYRKRGGKRIREQYADTGGFTDHVFAVTALLGYRFIPRIRDLPSTRLYVFDSGATPKALKPLIGGKIRENVIVANWPDILRCAATMAAGTIPPSQLLRKFAAYPRQHELAVALREIGRIERTLFIVEWLLDADMQRRANIGLNKGEAHHALKNALRIGR